MDGPTDAGLEQGQRCPQPGPKVYHNDDVYRIHGSYQAQITRHGALARKILDAPNQDSVEGVPPTKWSPPEFIKYFYCQKDLPQFWHEVPPNRWGESMLSDRGDEFIKPKNIIIVTYLKPIFVDQYWRSYYLNCVVYLKNVSSYPISYFAFSCSDFEVQADVSRTSVVLAW